MSRVATRSQTAADDARRVRSQSGLASPVRTRLRPGRIMRFSPSSSAVLALVLYVQAACIAPAFTIVVRADGAFRLESTSEHLREWHGGGDASTHVLRADGGDGSSDAWGGAHSHAAFAESDADDDEISQALPAPSPRVVVADVLAARDADRRPPRRPFPSRVPDDASFAAAESLFGRLVLNV